MSTPARPERVAILGGGAAAMSAAFELTSLPGWEQKYCVTVYQLGWRLGGKCAAGRGPDGRIEEHGLHVWFGTYANAFDMMNRCYGALKRDRPRAFEAQHVVVLKDPENGDWVLGAEKPRTDQWPSTGLDWTRGTPWTGVVKLTEWIEAAERKLAAPGVDNTQLRIARKQIRWLTRMDPTQHGLRLRTSVHKSVKDRMRAYHASVHQRLARYTGHDATRRLLIALDLAVAVVRGILEDEVWIAGYNAIDGREFREWLSAHDATAESVASAPIKALYDLAFAYPDGNYGDNGDGGRLSASTALRVIVGVVSDASPAMWKARWGMGDTVFAPLYEVLKQRGVKFKFFHRVKKVRVSPDGKRIERIEIDKQARLKSGRDDDYDPFIQVKGMKCWPNAPRWCELVDGEQLEEAGAAFESAWYPDSGETVTLARGDQFDSVILGISVAALVDICGDLVDAPDSAGQRWGQMLAGLQTVRTQALQLWLKATLDELGYDGRPPVLGGLGEPLSTWADMTHLIEAEDWPPDQAPRKIAYFCGVMANDPNQAPFTDSGYPATQDGLVWTQSVSFVDGQLSAVWPSPKQRAGIARALGVGPQKRTGDARFDPQFWRANIDPTERYVLSMPGTARVRLRADDSGFENLFLAGDWTWTELNCGAVEAAVMSGRHAVSGLTGVHIPILGIFGDDPLVAWFHRLRQIATPLVSKARFSRPPAAV